MKRWFSSRLGDRIHRFFVLLVLTVLVVLGWITHAPAFEEHFTVTQQASVNQLDRYPLKQTFPNDRYRPTGNWVGRLILPMETSKADWVWMEVYHAPAFAKDLQGQKIRLEWSPAPVVQQYVAAVTRDVQFNETVVASQKKGNLHPDRLNGRSNVGPLQSIAGAHPIDDVVVTLDQVTIDRQSGQPRLQIDADPVIETGRAYALVKVLAPVPTQQKEFNPSDCPGGTPCPSELVQVQHYNGKTKQFDGAIETVRIPQQPRDSIGVFASTPRELAKSSAGSAGWYLYGSQDKAGLFTVQALKPMALFQLKPQKLITDQAKGLDYVNYGHWDAIESRKGTLETVSIATPPKTQNSDPKSDLKVGQRAVVMHLFGGRGGKSGEAPMFGTVTGHFSYGVATVVREPLADELQWEVRYQQVYATNMEGFISGTNSWTAYMGDLRRGWLGTRPVSDVLVMLDLIEDYDFGSDRISPFQEFQRQLQVINARYRSGDGSGGAVVTPATSCVQDSNQALFATVQQVRKTVAATPAIQTWMKNHPTDRTTERFRRLIQLGDEVEKQLMPLGIVREDWKSNSEALSGTEIASRTFRRTRYEGSENLLAALTSWRTILPRQTQDELSLLFLDKGAQLWFLNTYQVGGHNPDILPIAPTKAFGRWAIPGTSIAVIAVLLTRLLGSIDLPIFTDWLIAIIALAIYSVIAIPIGFKQGFLQNQVWKARRGAKIRLAIKLFFLPALSEELVFRVLLLPAGQATTGPLWWCWAISSLILFVLYHPLNAMTLYKAGNPTFFDRRFLTLAALLGVTCTVTYAITHSLLLITLIHWIVVLVWLLRLGGMARLEHTTEKTYIAPIS